MITTVAQLLDDLLRESLPELDASDVSHGPTIGDMYEGISGEILRRAIPLDLGLRVTTGFLLREIPEVADWAPSYLGFAAFVILNELCAGETVRLSDTDLAEWCAKQDTTVNEVRDELIGTKLVAIDGDELVLVTTACRTAILPSGEFVAGEDSTGRFIRWVMARTQNGTSLNGEGSN